MEFLRPAAQAAACCLIMLTLPLAGPASADPVTAPAPFIVPSIPTITRAESDGSKTFTLNVEDLPGTITRVPLGDNALALANTALATAASLGVGPGPVGGASNPVEVGLFTNTWIERGLVRTTVGSYVADDDRILQFNTVVVEGADDIEDAIIDTIQRDALPVTVNTLPFLLNYAHPTSAVLFLGLLLGVLGVAVVYLALASAGYSELGDSLLTAYVGGVMLAPLFGFNFLYPYHHDPHEGEVYADFEDVYIWHALRRAGSTAVWQGHYIQRHGDYEESYHFDARGNLHMSAEAWKRVVGGPVVRVGTGASVLKLPGIYLRQEIHRDFAIGPSGMPFDADNTLSAGVYHPITGETPGASVRMEESKRGQQTLLYAPNQQDTISVGVQDADGEHVPLLGTRTEARHWPYTDRTNQGQRVAAIESYRITSFGAYIDGEYTPAFGIDYWGERQPTDLWALGFALAGPGDQMSGDIMIRTGVYNHLGKFIPVAGMRVDDDFQHHRHTYRSMITAGFVRSDPSDAGSRVPGKAPDRAYYHPLVGGTYDGEVPGTVWALADAGDSPNGMGRFLVASGVFGIDLLNYRPLVGVEFLPQSPQGGGRAQEEYRAGIFPADYRTFIPVASAAYDGDQTSLAWAQAVALGGGQPWSGTLGLYHTGYVPVAGVAYEPAGSEPVAHEFAVGPYVMGNWAPVASASVVGDPLACPIPAIGAQALGVGGTAPTPC